MTHEEYVAQVRAEMERLAGLLETPDAFRSWLEDWANADDYVGDAGTSGSCPLACYIGDSTTLDMGYAVESSDGPGGFPWSIECGVAEEDGFGYEPVTVPLPAWAGEFAWAVDQSAYPGARLTRGHVVRVLDQVTNVTA